MANGAGGSSVTNGAGAIPGGSVPMGNGGAVTSGAGGVTPSGGGGVAPAGSGGNVIAAGGVAGAGSSPSTGAGGTPVAPLPGTTFTITTTPFMVPPGGEMYMAQNFKNPLNKDVAITEAHAVMTKGSHHMFVFHGTQWSADSGMPALTDGTEFHPYLILSQSPDFTDSYPPGVGHKLSANEGLRVDMHYLNTGTDPINATVTVTFAYVDPAAVQHLASMIFLDNTGLFIGPFAMGQVVGSDYNLPYPLTMLRAISHMHSLGVHFTATSGQTMLYDGTAWDEPKVNVFSPPQPITGSIHWQCTYNNSTANVITFGEHAKTNEMCILAGLFYATDASSPQGQALCTPTCDST